MEKIVSTGTHNVQASVDRVLAIFKDTAPVMPAEERQRKNQSQLREVFDIIVNSADHAGSLFKRLTTKELEKAPQIKTDDGESKRVHPIVAGLIEQGYSYGTADKMLSQLIKFRNAYVNLRYVPNAGTSWDKAYAEATAELGKKMKADTKQRRDNKEGAFQAAYVAQAVQRLSAEDRKNPQKLGEATMHGIEEAEKQARQRTISDAAQNAWRAIGRNDQESAERTDELIAALQKLRSDWQTQASQQAQANQPQGNGTATSSPQGMPTAQTQAEGRKVVNS